MSPSHVTVAKYYWIGGCPDMGTLPTVPILSDRDVRTFMFFCDPWILGNEAVFMDSSLKQLHQRPGKPANVGVPISRTAITFGTTSGGHCPSQSLWSSHASRSHSVTRRHPQLLRRPRQDQCQ
jgi:hypothetical protein